MAQFLTDEWCAAVTDAAAELPAEALAGSPFVIRQVVRGGAPYAYDARIEDGRLRVTPTPSGRDGTDPGVPMVELITDQITAVSVAQGTLSVADALATGRVKVRGPVAILAERAAAVAALGVATRRVQGETSFT